jgi:hypothetical protein
MKNLLSTAKKNFVIYTCMAMMLISTSFIPLEAKASRGAAITGVVLGATALGVAGYTLYRTRNPRRYYYDDQPRRYQRPVGYRGYNRRPYYHGPRYQNVRYYDHHYDNYYY